MKIARTYIAFLVLFNCLQSCNGQRLFGSENLVLEKVIPMPSVKGRIDHMDINLKDQIVYIAALGNNSLEVIDIRNGKHLHSIKGLEEPQGVGYMPQRNEIFVANGGNGMCAFYNATSFEKVATVKLSSDADDVRYDNTKRLLYVGYGNGGIAMIDADSHKQVGDIKLPGHPEGFQLDGAINKMFVNIPGNGTISVIDLNKQKLTNKWPNEEQSNFPMAIDTINHTVFTGYRKPPKLIVIDGRTGRKLSSNIMVADADDLYYDERSKKIFVSGGSGYINVFSQHQNGYKQIANIRTRDGARTSLLVPQLRLLIVAARAIAGKDAELMIYKIAN